MLKWFDSNEVDKFADWLAAEVIRRYPPTGLDTDSKKAAPGTIRAKYGTDIEKNAVHGSDSPDNAKLELGFFFTGAEL